MGQSSPTTALKFVSACLPYPLGLLFVQMHTPSSEEYSSSYYYFKKKKRSISRGRRGGGGGERCAPAAAIDVRFIWSRRCIDSRWNYLPLISPLFAHTVLTLCVYASVLCVCVCTRAKKERKNTCQLPIECVLCIIDGGTDAGAGSGREGEKEKEGNIRDRWMSM